MTTYVAITNAQIDAESYIDTVLAAQWRDNVLAIQEGDATAPDLAAITGASLVLLDTKTASASAALDFTSNIDSTFSSYKFIFDYILPSMDNVTFNMRVSVDGGSIFLSTSVYRWALSGRSSDGNVHSTDSAGLDTWMRIAGAPAATLGNAAREGVTGEVTINRPSSTVTNKRIYGQTVWNEGPDTLSFINFGGNFITEASAVNAIRFFMSGGNIASGIIRMYGIKE